MDDECERVFLARVEVGRVEDESLNIVAIIVGNPKVRYGVRRETLKLRIDFIGREENVLVLTRVLLVEHAAGPGSGRGYKSTAVRENGEVGENSVGASEVDGCEVSWRVLGNKPEADRSVQLRRNPKVDIIWTPL